MNAESGIDHIGLQFQSDDWQSRLVHRPLRQKGLHLCSGEELTVRTQNRLVCYSPSRTTGTSATAPNGSALVFGWMLWNRGVSRSQLDDWGINCAKRECTCARVDGLEQRRVTIPVG